MIVGLASPSASIGTRFTLVGPVLRAATEDGKLAVTVTRMGAPRSDGPLGDAWRELVEMRRALEVMRRVSADMKARMTVIGADRLAVSGSDGIDAIELRDGNLVLAGAGDDEITVGAGNLVDGGEGRDVIVALGPDNILAGGAGGDRIDAAGRAVILGGAGGDTLRFASASIVSGGSGGDELASAGAFSFIDAGAGNDRIELSDGFNTVFAGSGDDTLRLAEGGLFSGGSGDDLIELGGTATMLYGRGDGEDTLRLTGGGPVTIRLGPGIGVRDIEISIEQDRMRVSLGGSGDAIVIEGVTTATLPSLVLAGGRTVDIRA